MQDPEPIKSSRAQRSPACWVSACLASVAQAADKNGEDDEENGPSLPNVYLDYRTTFSALPPGVIGFGLRGFPRLQVSSEASQGLTFDFPLSIDLTETLSLYGGPTTSTSRTDTSLAAR